jgi:hypothetical protein
MKDLVECRSEAEYAERPVALYFQDQRHTIQEILTTWQDPYGRYFRVVTTQHQVFQLFYIQAEDAWVIEAV